MTSYFSTFFSSFLVWYTDSVNHSRDRRGSPSERRQYLVVLAFDLDGDFAFKCRVSSPSSAFPTVSLVLRGKCQALFRRRRSSKPVRLSSLFLCYTLIISLDMSPGNDLLVFLSEYLPLIYFLLNFLAVLMILLSFILVFTCRYICAFRKRMCSYVRTTGALLLYASRVMNFISWLVRIPFFFFYVSSLSLIRFFMFFSRPSSEKLAGLSYH